MSSSWPKKTKARLDPDDAVRRNFKSEKNMNNIAAAKETINITASRKYTVNGRTVMLPDIDLNEVKVISPEDGQKLLDADMSPYMKDQMCRITINNRDSFEAGRAYEDPLVMNFANAHNPGGGFKLGANAQEEALCRCSTLYASITSDAARVMYSYNNTHISRVESDYFLISPNVVVFRDKDLSLLETPVVMGVVTIPAPNRRGAAMAAPAGLVEETFIRRIRLLLRAAAVNGYKDLVLGAWGCGAFGNRPDDVASYFRKVIVDEGLGRAFDEICFAIYGSEDGKNITAFRNCFKG